MAELNFVLFGAAGYVAPRHLRAIKENGGNLIAACDPHDSVGILDQYFPSCKFFTELERMDRYLDKFIRAGGKIDYVSICSPNYLHDAHCRYALKLGANAICEKPLVLHERNLDSLLEAEINTGKKVYPILQLREHDRAKTAKEIHSNGSRWFVKVVYHTPRGDWFFHSWKNDVRKSGGLATNIGIHLFDLLCWIFGKPQEIEVHQKIEQTLKADISFERAEAEVDLSVSRNNAPRRCFVVSHEPFKDSYAGYSYVFDDGFTELHSVVYRKIIDGNWYGIEDTRLAIRVAEQIRQSNRLSLDMYKHIK